MKSLNLSRVISRASVLLVGLAWVSSRRLFNDRFTSLQKEQWRNRSGLLLKVVVGSLLSVACYLGVTNLPFKVSGHQDKLGVILTSSQSPSTDLRKLELSFVRNDGQYPDQVKFTTQATGNDLFFTNDSVMINLWSPRVEKNATKKESPTLKSDVPRSIPLQSESIELKFGGSNTNVVVTGEEEKAGKFNYLKGNDERKWRTDIPSFKKVKYTNLYEGINLVFYGNQGKVQYDFVVEPQADPTKVRFSFPGARAVERNSSGDLHVHSQLGEVQLSRPVSYQINDDGERQIIESEFVVDRARTLSFRLGKYDKTRELIIDPVLTYSTLLGGDHEDIGQAVKADTNGYAYVTGSTHSVEFPTSRADFPTSPSGRKPIVGTYDAFVTKLTPDGADIVYSTVIGSSGDDYGYDIDVDSAGSAYVVGQGGTNFPQQNSLRYSSSVFKTANGTNNWQGTSGINVQIYSISVYDQNSLIAYAGGTGGVYKTEDGGNNWVTVNNGLPSNIPQITAVAVNQQNSAVVFAGGSSRLFKSVDGGNNWTAVNYYFGQDSFRSILVDRYVPQYVFATKGHALYRSTDGGNTWALINIGVAPNTNFYQVKNHPVIAGLEFVGVGGTTYFSQDFGATWANSGYGGGQHFFFDSRDPNIFYFVTPSGVFRTVISTLQTDRISTNFPFTGSISGFLQDPLNPSRFYATGFFIGVVSSTDNGVTWNSTSQGLPGGVVGTAIAFLDSGNSLVTGMDVAGAGRSFALKLNPNGDGFVYSTLIGWQGAAVAVDSAGRAHVAGTTSFGSLPLINTLRGYSGGDDGFIGIIQPQGRELAFSMYLGGAQNELLTDIALDPAGNIYVTGNTWSPDFPLIAWIQSSLRGQNDAFVTKIATGGTGFIYSTFYGGTGNEVGNAIAADSAGNAFVTGNTTSSNMPTGINTGIQPVFGGSTDSFIAELNPIDSTILYSTYLGGTDLDITHDIKVSQHGEIVVAGETKSVDFPTARSFKNKGPFTMSADRGLTWRNDVEGLKATFLNSIASNPVVPGVLLAGTDEGLYRSTDSGEHWTPSNTGINTRDIREVVFDPANPSIAYAGTTPTTPGTSVGGMYKSTDGGITWVAINNGISISTQQIYAVAVDPTNTNIIYAGSDGFNSGYPLYKSVNGGQTWSAIGAVVNISHITIDSTNSSIIYVTSDSTQPYVFRSPDGGSTWFTIGQGFARGRSIVIDPQDHSRLYAAVDNGIFYSTNQGASWQQVITNATGDSVAVDPFQPTHLYAGTSSGLYLSNDRGVSWTAQNSGLNHKEVLRVIPDTASPGVVYAGSIPFVESDAFVTKIAPSGTTFQYSTVFGSTGDPNVGNVNPLPLDYAFGVSLIPGGSVFSTGYTRYDNFPATPGSVSNHWSGLYDAFVVRLDESRKIFGKVTDSGGSAVDGVTLELSGSSAGSDTTRLDGKFKFSQVPVGGNFVLTPRKLGFSFQPTSIPINNLQNDFTGNFTAVGSTNTISGRVTQGADPVAGVIISLSGAASSSQQTAGDGTYSFQIPSGGDYEITASKPGLIFEPISQKVLNLRSNASVDFSARAGYLITGRVLSNGTGLSSVPIVLSGAERQSVLTDSNGRFSIQAGAGGAYTVKPVSQFAFAPPSINIPSLDSTQNLVFNAIPSSFTAGKIAFVSFDTTADVTNLDIFTYPAGPTTNLTRNLATDIDPVWSPDGNKLAFVSNRDGNWEIYVMNADGSNQTRVTNDPAADGEPTWSPDSQRIAFVRRPEGTNSAEIYVVNVDGSNPTRLTNNSIYEYSPAWSPDGSEIAFVSEQDGNAEIYTMDSGGTTRRRLTNNPLPDRNPAWSPDGTWIAFDSGLDGTRQIWKIRRNGSSLTQVTVGNGDNKSPSFSPDSQQIVFAGLCNPPGLATVNASGGNQVMLNSCGQYTETPSWQAQSSVRSKPFDFDGDGKTDVSVFRPSDGTWWYQKSSDQQVLAAQFGQGTDKVAASDFTGDGKTDIAFFRPSTGQWFVLRSEDGSFFSFPFGTSGDIPMPADYDGDGKADAAVFRPSSSTWFILRSSDSQVAIIPFGASSDLPVASDYDGDGKADIAIFRPSGFTQGAAEWWILRSGSNSVLALQFGSSTDKAVAADYTGDGKADVAFWRPSNGNWYVLRSEDFSYFSFPFGTAGDVPTPGDYDGDGKTDAAIFRPSVSTWFVNRTSQGAMIVAFGLPTDQPVPNALVR